MNQHIWTAVGIGGLLFVLIALFTPIGALFLTGIGILAFIIYTFFIPRK